MELDISGRQRLLDPTAEDLAAALAALPGGDADSFAVLSAAPRCFVQCGGSSATGFYLECCQGTERTMLRAVDAPLPLPTVVAVFQAFARLDADWDRGIRWESFDRITEGATLTAAPAQPDRLVEVNQGVVVLSRTWVFVGLALLLLALALGSMMLFPYRFVQRLALLAGGGAVVLLFLAWRSDSEQRGYRF